MYVFHIKVINERKATSQARALAVHIIIKGCTGYLIYQIKKISSV
jgi:hypothetical protein